MLQDGELILLLIKPSLWFVLLSSLKFVAVVLILMISAATARPTTARPKLCLPGIRPLRDRRTSDVGVLQWMGRLYILTDMRIVRLSGVFNVEIFDCPLRKVARTRLHRTIQERLTGVGTIEVIPSDEELPISYWNMVAKPVHVQEQIVTAISARSRAPVSVNSPRHAWPPIHIGGGVLCRPFRIACSGSEADRTVNATRSARFPA